jgi:hypothetical protein
MLGEWGLMPSVLSSRFSPLELLSHLKAPLSNVWMRRKARIRAVFRLDSGRNRMVH